MQSKLVSVSSIKPHPDNPRLIKDDKFKKLVTSILEFPKMLELRPIIVSKENYILGGNMRYKACIEAGIKEVPIVVAENLTKEEERQFVLKDNASFGEWDWDELLNQYNTEELDDWGILDEDTEILGSASESKIKEPYTVKIESPIYTPSQEKPSFAEVIDTRRYEQMLKAIEGADISETDKELLRFSAMRHIVFNYSKMADYYAHSEKKTQELMEDSALVIIDYNKAIELGFVRIKDDLDILAEKDA